MEYVGEIHKIQEVPVVFFTANASDEIRREIREVKAYGYLMKGMDRTVMLSTIEMAIQLHEAYERASMYHHIIENQVNEVYQFRQHDFAVLQTNLCAGKRTGYSKEEWKETSFLRNKPFLSEKNIMKDQLNNREAMLSAVVNSAQDGMVILDDTGQIVLWNHSG